MSGADVENAKYQKAKTEEFASNGFCSLGQVIPESHLETVRGSVERNVIEHNAISPPAGYVPGFLRFDQSLAPYLAEAPVYSFARGFFGDHVRISMISGIVNLPGFPRGALHADWPYNQAAAAKIPAPYPDHVIHMVTMWMLTDFTAENGATILVPGSHRLSDHPRGEESKRPHPEEIRMLGRAGEVVAFDARLWHAAAANVSSGNRVSALVRYAPWWLNLNTLAPGSVDHRSIVEASNGEDSVVPQLPAGVYDRLPTALKPLVAHSVESR